MTNLDLWRTLTFESPWRLWLLVVPVLLAAWELRRRGARVALPFDHIQHRGRKWLPRIVTAANALPAVLLAIAIIAWARPTVAGRPRQDRALTNIELVLDVSGSMTTPLGKGSRYDAAMQAITAFTSRRKGDAFGLTIFGDEVLRWTPLTKDISAIQGATPFLRPEQLPSHFGGTEIGKAVKFSARGLEERGDGDRLIILVTDGDSTDIRGTLGHAIGARLAESQIVLYAIKIGDESPDDLVGLCRPTGGEVFSAASPEALAGVFAHIDRMRPVKLKPAANERVDFEAPFALAGMAIAGLFGMALFGLRYTPW